MFIAILEYVKPLSEVDRYLAAHREFLAAHYAKGNIITSGPRRPRIGGVFMIKAKSLDQAEAIIAHDPFRINGIARYQIVEFTPTMFADEKLKHLLV